MSREIKVVRVYISEEDQGKRQNLMREIFSRLHDEHRVHGVTVFRGIAGFGAKGQIHAADLLRLHADLPLVVEFFDEPGNVSAALEWLRTLVAPEHIVHWTAFTAEF